MGPVHNDAHRFAPAAPHETHVFGSCSPGWHSAGSHEMAVEQWVEFMRDRGIHRVCCLLAGSTSEVEDSALSLYAESFGDENVHHAPVPARRLVDIDSLKTDILPFLETAVAAEERVVVHGLSGLGRTGQVLAAWLVAHHGYRPHEAVDTVTRMGRDPTQAVDRGPATRHELLDLLGDIA